MTSHLHVKFPLLRRDIQKYAWLYKPVSAALLSRQLTSPVHDGCTLIPDFLALVLWKSIVPLCLCQWSYLNTNRETYLNQMVSLLSFPVSNVYHSLSVAPFMLHPYHPFGLNQCRGKKITDHSQKSTRLGAMTVRGVWRDQFYSLMGFSFSSVCTGGILQVQSAFAIQFSSTHVKFRAILEQIQSFWRFREADDI